MVERTFGNWLIRPILYRIGHHAAHDGYDRLAEFVTHPCNVIRTQPIRPLARRLGARIYNRLVRHSPACYYTFDHWLNELRVCRSSMRSRQQVFHFVYGEDQYWVSGRWARRAKARIVATVHQPSETVSRLLRSARHFSHIDGLVLVAECQKSFWREFVPEERLFVVKHGIDVDYFRPAEGRKSNSSGLVCLTLGQWLRDFDLLLEVVDQFARLDGPKRASVQFRIVAPPAVGERFANRPNVTFRSGITDDELLLELQNAHLMLLPLVGATANTALLEALACGCPVLVTDTGGIKEYVNPMCATLVPPANPVATVAALRELMATPTRLMAMREAARRRALELSWRNIAVEMAAVYARVYELPPRG